MSRILVAIVMGSDSDLPIMKEASDVLRYFDVSHEVRILSAHRTADAMFEYAHAAKRRGILSIIAGAGGAAHLPGMIAAVTSIPVIGVPIKSSSLNGLDSLLSIVQMPPGVPVATVAINGARNAGLLACQIVGTKYKKIGDKVEDYKKKLGREISSKDARIKKLGTQKYKP
ncbi:MAG TPA: 5-(carboxyamino)imidazole ribonucleotide mutase [Nitrososphaeraceae archaeon]